MQDASKCFTLTSTLIMTKSISTPLDRIQFTRHWMEINNNIFDQQWKYQYFISTNSTLNPGYHTLDKNSRNSRILSLFIKTKNSRNSRIPSLFIKSTNRIRATIVLHLSGQKHFLSSLPLWRGDQSRLSHLSLSSETRANDILSVTL